MPDCTHALGESGTLHPQVKEKAFSVPDKAVSNL